MSAGGGAHRLWLWWVLAGTVAVGGYTLLPPDSLGSTFAYCGIGLCAAAIMIAAVRLHRPRHAAMWYWFAAGQVLWITGDIVYEYLERVAHVEPSPSVADAFYLVAYPLLAVGLLLLVRGRAGRDPTGLIDAAIVAVGMGLVFWTVVLHPIAAADSADVTLLEQVINTAYPAADALLLTILARLFTSAERRSPSTHMLALAVLLLLVADVGYSLLSLYDIGSESPLDLCWLSSYVAWAGAALHPSMRDAADNDVAAPQGRGRLVVLAACSLLAPVLLFVPAVADDAVNRISIGVGAVALYLLVLLRMSGFVGQVQRQADQLADLAMHDDLTGLPNRRHFEERLRAALERFRPHVALLDLNGFKNINDELGHSVGDRLLVVLAERLNREMGGDGLVARMGGDEFAVLIPDATPAGATVVIERLAALVQEPVVADGHELLVGGGIGVADSAAPGPGHRLDPYEMVRRADVAMYAAKESGEPYRWFVPEMDRQAGEQAQLGAELRTALDTGQFRMVYQPIVALPEGRMVAVEALVRWDHPERGTVSPAEFIPAAERIGLIAELGAWILRKACEQLAGWDHIAKVSVNVSARQLARPAFAEQVAAILAETGLPAHRLAVEVTETAVFQGGRAVEALHALRALGVQIALDDFGTGHSSLGLLQTVPVDILKVDKSFVDNITMAGRHAVIATSLIQVAAGLGLAAVAEGVETAEQAAELHRLGYRLAQGYYFGRPAGVPAVVEHGPPAPLAETRTGRHQAARN